MDVSLRTVAELKTTLDDNRQLRAESARLRIELQGATEERTSLDLPSKSNHTKRIEDLAAVIGRLATAARRSQPPRRPPAEHMEVNVAHTAGHTHARTEGHQAETAAD